MKFYNKFLLLCISASFFCCPVAKAADYTQEWIMSSNVLDYINAAPAYELGYTGSGIVVGVIDEMINVSHSELLGKATSNIAIFDDGTIFIPDWTLNGHGSHVAGIIAAARDGEGMFGVAYDSSIAGLVYLATEEVEGEEKYHNFSLDIEQFFQDNPDVRIVNNSWGSTFYPFEYVLNAIEEQYDTIESLFSYIEEAGGSIIIDLMNYAIDNPEILLIFAAGNDGQASASIEGLSPRYFGSELNNFISVGSLDIAGIKLDSSGNIESVYSNGVSIFSDLAVGAERWTVFAPGSTIYSLDAATGGYVEHSGTSMAAPVVSGVAAIVQQVFPWMTGSQLASTILSTANSDFEAPNYIVSFSDIESDIEKNIPYYFYIRYIVDDPSDSALTHSESDPATIKAMLSETISKCSYFDGWSAEEIDNLLDSIIKDGHYTEQYLTFEQVFGQGIVDLGAAIGGIAELDANRMTKDYVYTVIELGENTSYALENLNTAGYNAVFSNDITQLKWDDIYHHEEYQYGDGESTGYNDAALALNDLDIGIMKSGEGTLVLSGYNTYAGATVVTGGILALMTTTSADNSGTLAASSVVVRSGGIFTGNGFVGTTSTTDSDLDSTDTDSVVVGPQDLYNAGTVTPGADLLSWYTTASSSNNTLTVTGNYTQESSGTLEIYFDSNDYHTNLTVGGTAKLDGTLAFTPQADFYTDSSNITMSDYLTLTDDTGATAEGTFKTFKVSEISPTLSFTISAQNSEYNLTDYIITTCRAESAYTQYAIDATAQSLGSALYAISSVASVNTGDMQNLYAALDFTESSGNAVSSALIQLSPETYDNVTNTSFYQQNSYNASVLQNITFNSYAQQNMANTNSYYVADNSMNFVSDVAPRSAYYKNWEAWGSIISTYTQQNSSGNARDFESIATGLIAGYDRRLSEDFTLGTHAVFVAQRLTADDVHDATTDSVGMHIGVHGRYAPSKWNGVYINGLARIGFEYSDMERTVEIVGSGGTYLRNNQSNWTDFLSTVLLGVGKDWQKNNIYYGPVAWAEYVLLARPSITETGSTIAGANATRLSTEGDVYHSLLLSAGAHVGTSTNLNENTTVSADFLAAWQYDALGDDWETKASFVDYNAYSFTSTTDRLNHNSLLLQSSILFEKENISHTFFVEGKLKANLFNGTNISGGINLGFRF